MQHVKPGYGWLPFHFLWSVSEQGYRWEDVPGRENGDRYLELADLEGSRRIYEPLKDQPTLFLKFAEVVPTEVGILKFANKYGNLSRIKTGRKWEVGMDGIEHTFAGHTLKDWENEIQTMKDAVEVWDLARDGDREQLAKLIRWDGDVVGYHKEIPPTSRSELIAAPQFHPELREMWEPGETIGPAYGYLQHVLQKQLVKAVSLNPLWENSSLRMTFKPENLAYAIWVQFSEAVTATGDREYRRCEHCDGPFMVPKKRAYPPRRYCTNSCRVMAYRKKKESEK